METRSVAIVLTLVSLGIGAYLMAGQWQQTGSTSRAGSQAIREAGIAAATLTARQADAALAAYRAASGTYVGADLEGVHGATLRRADATSYCLELAADRATLYERGPGGAVGSTPC
jgi:hypothetical protein